MKTSELSGPALDWAVAKCEGIKVITVKGGRATFSDPADDGALNEMPINYSTDWSQGGPIIEREGIALQRGQDGLWWARIPPEHFKPQILTAAPTPLVAAMRCYVASKLGDEIEIPEEFN